WDGTTWTPNPTSYNNSIRAIWGAAANDVWAMGDSTAFHWNGSSWTSQIGLGGAFQGAWGTDASHIWAVTDQGQVYKWNGAMWRAEQTDVQGGLFGVWGTDA